MSEFSTCFSRRIAGASNPVAKGVRLGRKREIDGKGFPDGLVAAHRFPVPQTMNQTDPSNTGIPIASAGATFSVVNGAVLFMGTLTGAWCTVYADLFPGSTLASLGLWLAAAWVAGIVLLLFVLGHHEKNIQDHSLLGRVRWGAHLLRSHAGYAALVLFMLGATVFSVYSKQVNDKRSTSVLKDLVANLANLDRASGQTRLAVERAASSAESTERKADLLLKSTGRIEATVNRDLKPRERLAKNGVAWTPDNFSAALVDRDVETVRLFIEAGWNVRSAAPASEGGNALGQFAGHPRVVDEAATVAIVRLLAGKLDLTAHEAAFRGLPPMNLVSVALMRCNAGVVRALATAGVDVRLVHRTETPSHLGGTIIIDPVTELTNWKPPSWEHIPCTAEDRRLMTNLVQPTQR